MSDSRRIMCRIVCIFLLAVAVSGRAHADEVSVAVFNTTAEQLQIFWVPSAGPATALGTIDAGTETTITAEPGTVLRASNGTTFAAQYMVTGPGASWSIAGEPPPSPSAPTVATVPPSPPPASAQGGATGTGGGSMPTAGAPTVLAVRNDGAATAELFWVQPDGTEESIGTLAPQASNTVNAEVRQVFRFRVGGTLYAQHVVSGADGETFVSGAAPAVGDVVANGLPAATVEIEFSNLSVDPIEAYTIDNDGAEVPVGAIDGGIASTMASVPGLWWRFRWNGLILSDYLTTDAPSQSAIISGPDVGAEPVVLDLQNQSADAVDYYLVGADNGEQFVKSVPAGYAAEQPSQPNELWRFKRNGAVVGEYLADNRSYQEYPIP